VSLMSRTWIPGLALPALARDDASQNSGPPSDGT
jgi:hypothetical protein